MEASWIVSKLWSSIQEKSETHLARKAMPGRDASNERNVMSEHECKTCGGLGTISLPSTPGTVTLLTCPTCDGHGDLPETLPLPAETAVNTENANDTR